MELGTVLLTLVALVAFASNSLITRLALGTHAIDAASFTLLRLASGAAVLSLLVRAQGQKLVAPRGAGALGPLALFGYAAPFSFAYLPVSYTHLTLPTSDLV